MRLSHHLPILTYCLSSFTLRTTSATTTTTFSASSEKNLAVYFGHSTGNFNASLPAVCNATGVDIVILGFIREFASSLDTLPTFDFTPTCEYNASTATNATFTCPELAEDIVACQGMGKKIFISIGGSTSETSFGDESSAALAANNLWNIFGSGSSSNKPLGNVTVDGFDIDHESSNTTHYDTFTSTLRTLISSNKTTSHTTYLSAAPICANTSIIFPATMYATLDFVWPQFYNAEACDVSSSGFNASFVAWAEYIAWNAPDATYPKLYLGAIDFKQDEDGGSGFVEPDVLEGIVEQARGLVGSRFGGVMLWDGTNGLETMEDGEDFIEIMDVALESGADVGSARMDVWWVVLGVLMLAVFG